MEKLVELSELLALPVMDQENRFNFPNTHPLDLSESDCLELADLLLALDVRDLAGPTTRPNSASDRSQGSRSILPKDCRIIDMGFGDLGISSFAMAYEKIQETDLSILCDTSVALPELIKRCREKLSADRGRKAELEQRFKRLNEKHAAIRNGWKEEARKNWDAKPMTVPRMTSEVGR